MEARQSESVLPSCGRRSERKRRRRESYSPETVSKNEEKKKKGSKTNNQTSNRQFDVLPNGEPFSCHMCKSPYVVNPHAKGVKKAGRSRHTPLPRVWVDKATGNEIVLCTACFMIHDRSQRAPVKPVVFVSEEDKQQYQTEAEQFVRDLRQRWDDELVERLYCPVNAKKLCGCLQKYINSGKEAAVSKLVELMKTAQELRKEKYNPNFENKSMGVGNGHKKSKRYEEFVLLERRWLRDDARLCERGAQRVLMYSNNFLHKRLKTENRPCRIERTRGKNLMGKLPDIAGMIDLHCCQDNCVMVSLTHRRLLQDWRNRAQLGQTEARRVVAEMLTPAGACHLNCYTFISMVTGCSTGTIVRVYRHMLTTGGEREPMEHGMKRVWQEKAARAGTSVQDESVDDEDEEESQSEASKSVRSAHSKQANTGVISEKMKQIMRSAVDKRHQQKQQKQQQHQNQLLQQHQFQQQQQQQLAQHQQQQQLQQQHQLLQQQHQQEQSFQLYSLPQPNSALTLPIQDAMGNKILQLPTAPLHYSPPEPCESQPAASRSQSALGMPHSAAIIPQAVQYIHPSTASIHLDIPSISQPVPDIPVSSVNQQAPVAPRSISGTGAQHNSSVLAQQLSAPPMIVTTLQQPELINHRLITQVPGPNLSVTLPPPPSYSNNKNQSMTRNQVNQSDNSMSFPVLPLPVYERNPQFSMLPPKANLPTVPMQLISPNLSEIQFQQQQNQNVSKVLASAAVNQSLNQCGSAKAPTYQLITDHGVYNIESIAVASTQSYPVVSSTPVNTVVNNVTPGLNQPLVLEQDSQESPVVHIEVVRQGAHSDLQKPAELVNVPVQNMDPTLANGQVLQANGQLLQANGPIMQGGDLNHLFELNPSAFTTIQALDETTGQSQLYFIYNPPKHSQSGEKSCQGNIQNLEVLSANSQPTITAPVPANMPEFRHEVMDHTQNTVHGSEAITAASPAQPQPLHGNNKQVRTKDKSETCSPGHSENINPNDSKRTHQTVKTLPQQIHVSYRIQSDANAQTEFQLYPNGNEVTFTLPDVNAVSCGNVQAESTKSLQPMQQDSKTAKTQFVYEKPDQTDESCQTENVHIINNTDNTGFLNNRNISKQNIKHLQSKLKKNANKSTRESSSKEVTLKEPNKTNRSRNPSAMSSKSRHPSGMSDASRRSVTPKVSFEDFYQIDFKDLPKDSFRDLHNGSKMKFEITRSRQASGNSEFGGRSRKSSGNSLFSEISIPSALPFSNLSSPNLFLDKDKGIFFVHPMNIEVSDLGEIVSSQALDELIQSSEADNHEVQQYMKKGTDHQTKTSELGTAVTPNLSDSKPHKSHGNNTTYASTGQASAIKDNNSSAHSQSQANAASWTKSVSIHSIEEYSKEGEQIEYVAPKIMTAPSYTKEQRHASNSMTRLSPEHRKDTLPHSPESENNNVRLGTGHLSLSKTSNPMFASAILSDDEMNDHKPTVKLDSKQPRPKVRRRTKKQNLT